MVETDAKDVEHRLNPCRRLLIISPIVSNAEGAATVSIKPEAVKTVITEDETGEQVVEWRSGEAVAVRYRGGEDIEMRWPDDIEDEGPGECVRVSTAYASDVLAVLAAADAWVPQDYQ
jgi:hypothetical protein